MSARKTSYGHGHVAKTANGTYAASLSRFGSRARRVFKTRAEAEAWIDAQSSGAPALSAAQLREAAEAYALLPPGTSLLEALKPWMEQKKPEAVPVHELMSTYLEEAAKRLRNETLIQYRRHLNRALSSEILGDTLDTYTKAAIRRYLDSFPTRQGFTKALRTLSAFFTWLTSRDILAVNPTATIKAPRQQHSQPAVLTLTQAEHLLETAATFERGACLPYIAVCMFAGLRPTEAMRLRPADIGEEYITLTAAQTKTAAARTVPILPNLKKILSHGALSGETILPCSISRFHKHLTNLIKKAGFKWTPDILRHSFASYRYEQTRDAAATAYEMGHRGTDIFFRHYRGLVSPGTGAKYFSLGCSLPFSRQICQSFDKS